MRRVLMPSSPGPAISDRPGDCVTSAFGARERLGQRIGQRHAQALGHGLRQLFGNVAQLRHHALAHGRRLDFGEFEAKRPRHVIFLDVALALVKQRGLVVVLGEFFRLAAHLVLFDGLSKRHEAFHAGLKRAAAAERIGFVGGAAAMNSLQRERVRR